MILMIIGNSNDEAGANGVGSFPGVGDVNPCIFSHKDVNISLAKATK